MSVDFAMPRLQWFTWCTIIQSSDDAEVGAVREWRERENFEASESIPSYYHSYNDSLLKELQCDLELWYTKHNKEDELKKKKRNIGMRFERCDGTMKKMHFMRKWAPKTKTTQKSQEKNEMKFRPKPKKSLLHAAMKMPFMVQSAHHHHHRITASQHIYNIHTIHKLFLYKNIA